MVKKKTRKVLILLSLFSCLVSSCITVSRIDKKDSRNNQFSNRLQNWMYVKHPQKIDTISKMVSDTVISWKQDTIIWLGDTTITPVGGDSSFTLWGDTGISTPSFRPVDLSSITLGILPVKTKTITINHYITNTVVNRSEINALTNALKASRDSINYYVLLATQRKVTSLKYLIWALVASLLLGISGYFNFKKIL